MSEREAQPNASIIQIAAIAPGGLRRTVIFDATRRRDAASRLCVPAIRHLKGEFDVTRTPEGVRVECAMDALLERECVISLDPMEETLVERFEIFFSADGQAEIEDLEVDEDTPEPLEGEDLDLAEILIQQASLAMAPYPRKASAGGVRAEYQGEGPASPFAGLAEAFAEKDERE